MTRCRSASTLPDMTAPVPVPRTAPPLLRRPDDRVLAGVCAAVARTTGTDPVLWRVVLGVLTLFGGTGLLLYAAGWLLIPAEGEDTAPAQRLLHGRVLSRSAVVVLVLALALAAGSFADDGAAAPVLAAALLVYVVVRRSPASSGHCTAPAAPSSSPAWLAPPVDPWAGPAVEPWSAPAGSADAPYAPPAWSPDAPYAPPGMPVTSVLSPDLSRPVPPRPSRSALGPLTIGAALLLVAALLAAGALGVGDPTVGRLLAAVLLVVGCGLLVGARWGRSRGLVVLAALLCAALALTSSARVPVDLSLGQRTWVVRGSDDLRLGVGEAVLDLRGLPTAAGTAPTDVRVRLGAGHLVVLLPAGARVDLDARLSAGEAVLPGADTADGTSVQVLRTYGPAAAPPVRLDVRIGAGQLEVRDGATPAAPGTTPAPAAPAGGAR